MWEMWRSHDVFESGTVLDDSGTPVAGARNAREGALTSHGVTRVIAGRRVAYIHSHMTMVQAIMTTTGCSIGIWVMR